jgi:outer membrane protein assembly factor BamB
MIFTDISHRFNSPSARRRRSSPMQPGLRRAGCALALAFAGMAFAGMASAADWPQYQADAARSGVNASESAFTPENIPSLGVAWNGFIGSDVASEGGAVIAGKTLFVAGFDGKLSAFDVDGCKAATCQPLWQGSAAGDITSTPAVSGGFVAVSSQDGFVHVFDAKGCGGAAQCDALWRGQLSGASIDSSVVIAAGNLYVADFEGQLAVFPLAGCRAAVCAPTWTGHAPAGDNITAAPAVGDGFVYVQTTIAPIDGSESGGHLLAFPAAGCAQATCDIAWSADLGGPSGTRSGPMVAGDKVIVGSSERLVRPNSRKHLFAFDAAGCGQSVCRPAQTFDVGFRGADDTVTVSGSLVLVSSNRARGSARVGVVMAFDLATCDTLCEPLWTGVNPSTGAISPPAVAGDLVFVGKGPASFDQLDAGVYAFDIHGCGHKDLCQPLTFVQSFPVATYFGAPLAIADDRIAFVSTDSSTLGSYVSVMTLR